MSAPSIDLYCEQSAMLNAYVWPPEGDRVVIVVTNQLLERLDDAELSFVLGHELGHVLVGHTQMPHATEDSGVSPLVAMRLLSWGRSAEMSADRFGLLACDDIGAAVRVAFKLASGLSDPRVVADVQPSTGQFDELEEEGMDPLAEDWFATHPYGPLRLRALELFARSRAYHAAKNREGGELSDEDLDREVQKLAAMMDPVVLHEDLACGAAVKRFLLLAGALVAAADGATDEVELSVLQRFARGEGATQGATKEAEEAASTFGDILRGFVTELTKPDLSVELADAAVKEAVSMPTGEIERRLEETAAVLREQLFAFRRYKLIEDLVAVAVADGRVDPAEIAALVTAARALAVEPRFVEAALARASAVLD